MRRSPVQAVLTSIVTTLKASTGVTGRATGGVFNNVPQGTLYPYLVVTSPTDRPVDTMGRFGSNLLVDVKAVSQYQGDAEAAVIIDHAQRVLHFAIPATTGHSTLGIAFETGERFTEVVNGILTRHHVATFRVWTEQSSS